MMRRLSLSGLIALFVVLTTGTAAVACEDGWCGGTAATVDNRAVEARAFDWSTVTAGTAQSSSPCMYASVSTDELDPDYLDAVLRHLVASGARFYRVSCDGGSTWRVGWWRPTQPATNDGAFHDVLQEAIDRLAPGTPTLDLSPAADARHIVGVPTWLAVTPASWRTWSMQVQAGMVTVEVRLSPRAVEWTLGDGGLVTCDGPGARFAAGMATATPVCAHTFLTVPSDSGTGDAFVVQAQIRYRASYTVSTPYGSAGTTLGTILGPPQSHDVVVSEYRAVRTPWHG